MLHNYTKKKNQIHKIILKDVNSNQKQTIQHSRKTTRKVQLQKKNNEHKQYTPLVNPQGFNPLTVYCAQAAEFKLTTSVE